MKNKWLWVALAGTLGFVILFIAAIFIAAAIFGGDRHFVGSGVGLVEVKGLIIDSQETVKQLNEFRKNDSVKAVVLRIDSPAGWSVRPRKSPRRSRSWRPGKRWSSPWGVLPLPAATILPLRPR